MQFRMQPSGAVHAERPVAAGIAAHAGRQHALQRVGRVRGGVVVGAVRAAARQLRRRALEVDLDLVAPHRELERDSAAACRARCSRSRTGRRRPAPRAIASRIAVSERPCTTAASASRSCMPYSSMKASEPLGAERVGGDQGVQVAQHLLALADVLGEQAEAGPRSARPRGTASSAGSGSPPRRSRARAGSPWCRRCRTRGRPCRGGRPGGRRGTPASRRRCRRGARRRARDRW